MYQLNLIELLEEEILLLEHLIGIYLFILFLNLFYLIIRMAPEVIACDENPQATYDNRVFYYYFSII